MLRSIASQQGGARYSSETRCDAARLFLLLVVVLLLPATCRAEDHPARPIHLVVPFPPGGVTDIIARHQASRHGRAMSGPSAQHDQRRRGWVL